MYVLTIQEPYATAMYKGYKINETRGWKASDKYLGQEIYIHAGLTNHPSLKTNEWLRKFTSDNLGELHHGYIICKGKLSKIIKTENMNPSDIERRLGFYEDGRYAWCFDNIETIEPIKATGHLGIWRYYGKDY